MKSWVTKGFALLDASLSEPRHELNELDWKQEISPDSKRLGEHLCAMANQPGGGYLVFGVANDGELSGVTSTLVDNVMQKLSSIARQGVEPPVMLDHSIESFRDGKVLFIHVIESTVKPVHPRGKSIEEAHIRSGGTTRKASRQEIGQLMLHSRTPKWEQLTATTLRTAQELADLIATEEILALTGRERPKQAPELVDWLASEDLVSLDPSEGGYVTNLGAIAAAHRIEQFPELSRKAVRVVVYNGADKSSIKLEREGKRGYAVSFEGLLEFVSSQLPQAEVIEKSGLRVKHTVYPELALRELIANALIHQDFTISGAGPLIEIFSDRVTITNPGNLLPSKQVLRLIGTPPESRNELLAKKFRRYKICEELGSGLFKSGVAAELHGLPPIKFEATDGAFRVTLFGPRSYSGMSAAERIAACYQHAVIRYLSGDKLTNKSLRDRLRMPDRHRSMVSVLIQETLTAGLIKPADPDNRSRKLTEYLPFWA